MDPVSKCLRIRSLLTRLDVDIDMDLMDNVHLVDLSGGISIRDARLRGPENGSIH